MKFYTAYALVVGIALSSCSHRMDGRDYLEWVQDEVNGLRVSRDDGPYFLSLQYQPAEMVYLLRHGGGRVEAEELESRMRDISALQYYVLTIGLKDTGTDFLDYGGRDEAEKQRLIYYLSYPFQDDLELVENGYRHRPVLYHFERSMDMKNSRTMVLGFENTGLVDGRATLEIESPFLGFEGIKLEIDKKHRKTPRL